MRYWFSYFVTSFCFTIGTFFAIWFTTPVSQIQASKEMLTTPLPASLTYALNNQVTSLTYWFPPDNFTDSTAEIHDLTAKSALAYDLTTDQYLYVRNVTQRMPMASLTKLMTAIVAIEHPKPGDAYVVHQQDLVGEDSMGLEAGEKLSLEELLYGVFLHSANDAATVIADNTDAITQFTKDMNNKALALGLKNTHFTNPSGLEGDGDQYTTAYDLLILARYGLQFQLFQKTSSAVSISIPQTNSHKEYDLSNETNLMTTYPGVDGLKTGYTPEAGLCLVTDLRYGGHHIIAILLGSDDRRNEMIKVLDYSLKKLGITPPLHE